MVHRQAMRALGLGLLLAVALGFNSEAVEMMGVVHSVRYGELHEFFHGHTARPKVVLIPPKNAAEEAPAWFSDAAPTFGHADDVYSTALFAYIPPWNVERVAKLFQVQVPTLLGCRSSPMFGWVCHQLSSSVLNDILSGTTDAAAATTLLEVFVNDLLDRTSQLDNPALDDSQALKLPHLPQYGRDDGSATERTYVKEIWTYEPVPRPGLRAPADGKWA